MIPRTRSLTRPSVVRQPIPEAAHKTYQTGRTTISGQPNANNPEPRPDAGIGTKRRIPGRESS
jgi:hypothetical protein